jgi:hypothetical protein
MRFEIKLFLRRGIKRSPDGRESVILRVMIAAIPACGYRHARCHNAAISASIVYTRQRVIQNF